jgi:SAM-dependent methyltransferase
MTAIAPREARLASWLAPWIPRGARVVDIGAGSGLLAEALGQTLGIEMTLVDVVDYNRSRFPLRTYDGRTLPFGDRAFDVALLAFSLHHSDDPRRTLREAGRVAPRLVVLEDTYRTGVERLAMRWTDRILNRGHGVQAAWGQWRPEQWQAFLDAEPVRIVHAQEYAPRWIGRGRDPIRHILLVAEAAGR